MKTIIRSGVVKKMREIRDKMSLEIMDMTPEEEREYLRKLIAERNAKDAKLATQK